MKMGRKKRFEILSEDASGSMSMTRVVQDKETGVCYMFHMQGVSSGLTVLLNADGTPYTA